MTKKNPLKILCQSEIIKNYPNLEAGLPEAIVIDCHDISILSDFSLGMSVDKVENDQMYLGK